MNKYLEEYFKRRYSKGVFIAALITCSIIAVLLVIWTHHSQWTNEELRTLMDNGSKVLLSPISLKALFKIPSTPMNAQYTGEYTIERQDGNETFYDVNFNYINNTAVEINFNLNFDKVDDKGYNLTAIKYEPSLKENFYINDEKAISKPLDIKVTDDKGKEIITKPSSKDITKVEVTKIDKVSYTYTANPKTDRWLKFGDNSIVIVQAVSYASNYLGTNITGEPNNISHLTMSTQTPYDTLVGYWNFDGDRVNKTAYDFSGNNNDGTYVRGAFINTTGCLYDDCAGFDGINDYIQAPTTGSLNITSNEVSLSFWFYSTRNYSVSQYVFIKSTGYGVKLNDGVISAIVYNSTGGAKFTSGKNYGALNVWNHYAFTYNGTTIQEYLNGINRLNTTFMSGLTTASGITYIGTLNSATQNNFSGNLDEIMIFNSSLNSSMILQIYQNQSGRFMAQGTQEITQFNISSGTNRVNVSLTDFENKFGSNVSFRLGQWDVSLDYNLTDLNSTANGLVAYWNLDNRSSLGENQTFVADRIGMNNGTAYGGVSMGVGGVYNKGAKFDGISDYISIPNNIILQPMNFSISLWFNPYNTLEHDLGTARTFISKVKVLSNDGFILRYNKDVDGSGYGLQFVIYTGGDSSPLTIDANYSANKWYNVIATYGGGNQKIYVDGNIGGTIGGVTFSPQTTLPLTIGAMSDNLSGENFNGVLDEIIMFNRSLTSNEIKELYVKGRALWNYTSYQSIDTINTNYTFNISSITTNLLPAFKLASDSYNFYSSILAGNINLDTWNVSEGVTDIEYPIFSAYYDNNATLNGTGIALFNVTLLSTNGTVILQINGTNYTAKNLTADIYNISLGLSNGTYSYYWGSWGNGTSHNYNISNTRYYTLNNTLSSCRVLSEANTIYTLLNNVNSTGTCFNITANNITLDGNGYEINYSSAGTFGYGVYINSVPYGTIKNIVIKEGTSARNSEYAIYLNTANNAIIKNNTIITSGNDSYGIYLYPNSNNNSISNNLITTTGTSGHGVYLYSNSNSNILLNNIINTTGTSGHGVRLESVSNSNTLSNNTITTSGSSGWGIYLQNSLNNIFLNNQVTTLNSSGILLYLSSTNNSFSKMNILVNGLAKKSFDIYDYNPNLTITDSIFNSSDINGQEVYVRKAVTGGTWNFTNVTRSDGSAINVNWTDGGNGTLLMNWYLDVNVTDYNIAPLSGVSVNSTQANGTLVMTTLTDNYGLTRQILREYMRNGTTTDYSSYSNYTIAANKTLYLQNTTSINMTANKNIWMVLGAVESEYPVFSNYYDNNASLTGSGIALFNVTLLSTNGTVFLQINGTNYTAKNLTADIYNISLGLSNGTYSYYWGSWSNGTNHYYNTSGTRYYTLNNTPAGDTTPPYFTAIPANQSVAYGNGLGVDFNATDGVSFGTYYLGNWTNKFTINSSGWLKNVSSLGAGMYIINVSINDSSGNTNMTWYNLTITKITSQTGLTFDKTSPQTYGTAITPTCNLITGVGSVSLTNGTSGVAETLGAGAWNLNCSYAGNTNYSASSNLSIFTIAQNGSFALVLSGTTPIIYPQITDFTGSGCPSQLSCALNISNQVYGVGTISANYSTAGNNNYTANSTTKTITINKNQTALGLSATTPITYGTTTDFAGTGCNSQISCSLNITNEIYGAGIINANYSSNGNSNYTGSSAVFGVTINKASQTITSLLNGVNSNLAITYPQQINASTSGTNNTALTISINGSTISKGLNYTWGAGFWIVNYTSQTNQNYSLYQAYRNITISSASSLVYTNINNSRANITIYANETLLLNGTLITGNINSGLNLSLDNTQLNYSTTRNLSYVYNFTNVGTFLIKTNYSGNQNYSSSNETWVVTVNNAMIGDIIKPYFTTIPADASLIYGQSLGVDFDGADETAFDNYRINWTEYFNINKTGWLNNISALGVGTYNINVTINDTANNLNSTIFSLTINKATGLVYTYINGSRSNKVYVNNSYTNLSGFLINGIGSINLYINNTLWNSGASPLINISQFTTGTYIVNTTYLGNQNYTYDDELWTLNIVTSAIGNCLNVTTLKSSATNKRPYGRLCYKFDFR